MQNPLIALDKIESLLTLWYGDRKNSAGYYSACKIILRELYAVSMNENLSSYIKDKLRQLDWYVNAMFGVDTDNGYGFDNHLEHARRAIISLSGDLGFGVHIHKKATG